MLYAAPVVNSSSMGLPKPSCQSVLAPDRAKLMPQPHASQPQPQPRIVPSGGGDGDGGGKGVHASMPASGVTPSQVSRPPTCAHVMPRQWYVSSNADLTAAKSGYVAAS